MAQDSDNEFKVKIDLEPDKDSAVEASLKDLNRDNLEHAQNLKKASSDLADASKDLDKAMAKGYNPNAMMNDTGANNVQKASSLPKKDTGLNKDSGSKEERPSTPVKKANPREGAPDVGKDYGSSMPPSEPRPVDNSSDQPIRRNNGYQGNNPSVPENTEGNGSGGLPRKNDLEDQDSKDDKNGGNKPEKDEQNKDDKNGDNKDVKPGDSEKNPEAPNKLDKDKVDEQNNSQNNGQTANNYRNLRRKPEAQEGEKPDRFRQNLEHSRRVREGENSNNQSNAKSSSGSINEEVTPSIGARLKSGLKNLLSGKAGTEGDVSDNSNGRSGKSGNNAFNKALGTAKKAIINFLKTHPHVAIILAIVILFFLILIITTLSDELDGNGKSNGKCNYSLNGVLTTGTVNLEGIQVELVNCDAKASNYTVLETVDFEKYVVGVALAEVGYSRDKPEYFKTEIVAARNFALTRNSSMCPSNPDDCFYGYNQNTGKIRMRACEADQVYWDYDKDIYRYDRGAISLYSPEINSGTIWKRALDEATKEEVLAVAEEVKGKVLVDDSGNVVHTDYINTDQQEWSRLEAEGHTYDEILSIHYGGGSISGATCSSGIIDYGDYVLSSDGHTILHEPLDSFLEKQGTSLEAFNGLIEKNVEKAGFGTRAGVVAAAVTLIAELGNNYNVKVPYYWGGGHADGVVIGALGYWGSTQCHTYANNQSYNYCGLDCSGFVPWAIKNGGFNIAQMLAGGFQNMSGVQKVSLTNSAILEPGDLLESSGHIVLVVGIEESTGNYICAEASGNAAGVLFTRRPFNSSGYWGIKMDGWYSTHQRSEGT